MSSYVFINSMSRNVYEYPNSSDFTVSANVTENWNLIRSVGPSLPIQRSQNQYYNVKVCSLQLPAIPEILNLPGVFVSFKVGCTNKNTNMINHISLTNESGFPCDALVGGPDCDDSPLEEITEETDACLCFDECTPPTGDRLRDLNIKKIRGDEGKKFYKNSRLNDTSFFMICDKIQFNGEGEPKWVQYKSCMDQVIPLNLRGNSFEFSILDQYGRTIILNEKQIDPFYPHMDTSPTNPCRQVLATLELTYLQNKFLPERYV